MTKKKITQPLPPKLKPVNVIITEGSRADLDAIFHTLTIPYTGRWHARGYHNDQLIWANDGGQQDINIYFNDK